MGESGCRRRSMWRRTNGQGPRQPVRYSTSTFLRGSKNVYPRNAILQIRKAESAESTDLIRKPEILFRAARAPMAAEFSDESEAVLVLPI